MLLRGSDGPVHLQVLTLAWFSAVKLDFFSPFYFDELCRCCFIAQNQSSCLASVPAVSRGRCWVLPRGDCPVPAVVRSPSTALGPPGGRGALRGAGCDKWDTLVPQLPFVPPIQAGFLQASWVCPGVTL